MVAEAFPRCENISVDYAVMEKANNVVGIAADDFGWNDVGNWEQYGSLFPANDQGVRGLGHHQELGSQNIFVYNDTPRQVFTIGLEDVIVVEMQDKTVICHKDCVQRIKELAEDQKKKM